MQRNIHRFIKDIVKSQQWIYTTYSFLGSAILNLWGLFIRENTKTILFITYGGKRYDDSPRKVYEYMKNDVRFSDFNLVWAFENPDAYKDLVEKSVKVDTLEYFKIALTAHYWITNSSATRGLNFLPQSTINIFFTHGMTGIKKIGTDLKSENVSFHSQKPERRDIIVIEGKKEEEIIRRAWNLQNEKILNIGLPRNDDLVNQTAESINNLKVKLGIPNDKQVILYAPTFREYKRDSSLAVYLAPPFDFDKWYAELGEEYILLLTAHYEVSKLMNVPNNHPFIVNAFGYENINDLMLVSDLLISDYSSIIFDYSILERPIFSYAYDYEQYVDERGIYDGYENLFFDGINHTEDELINKIKNMDYYLECQHSKKIKETYITNYGNAAKEFCDIFAKEYLE